jgi:hypothetical protein
MVCYSEWRCYNSNLTFWLHIVRYRSFSVWCVLNYRLGLTTHHTEQFQYPTSNCYYYYCYYCYYYYNVLLNALWLSNVTTLRTSTSNFTMTTFQNQTAHNESQRLERRPDTTISGPQQILINTGKDLPVATDNKQSTYNYLTNTNTRDCFNTSNIHRIKQTYLTNTNTRDCGRKLP